MIGAGNIGKTHLTSIVSLREAQLLDVEVAAICDIDREALRNSGEFFDVQKRYEHFTELVESSDVDVVYICTPTNLHPEMVRAVVKAAKPVFCEKPLAHTCAQASDLLTLTKKAGIPAGIGLVLRFDQFILYAKNLIDTCDLGKPMLVHIRDDQRIPVGYLYYSQWRGDLSIAGGGTLIEHSIHDIDLLRWFLGDADTVYAKTSHFSGKAIEDQASLIVTHRNGSIGTLDSVWHWVERPSERMIEFFFEKGWIAVKLGSDEHYLEYQLQGGKPVRVTAEMANPALLERLGLTRDDLSAEGYELITSVGNERYLALSYSLLKAIQANRNPSPDFADAVEAHRVVDAAYESAKKGKLVRIL